MRIIGKMLLMIGLFMPFLAIVKGLVRLEKNKYNPLGDSNFELATQLTIALLVWAGFWILIW